MALKILLWSFFYLKSLLKMSERANGVVGTNHNVALTEAAVVPEDHIKVACHLAAICSPRPRLAYKRGPDGLQGTIEEKEEEEEGREQEEQRRSGWRMKRESERERRRRRRRPLQKEHGSGDGQQFSTVVHRGWCVTWQDAGSPSGCTLTRVVWPGWMCRGWQEERH